MHKGRQVYEVQYSKETSKGRGLSNLIKFLNGEDSICCTDWKSENGKCTLIHCNEEESIKLLEQDWVNWIYPHHVMLLRDCI